MRELSLFTGAGGGLLGSRLLGWTTVCGVEIDAYCREVLFARQKDGSLPRFPVWDDIRTFDGRPWRGLVDVVSGGFPCQDISIAGNGRGLDGERSGLWVEMARIIGEVRPRYAFVENSPALTYRGLDRILGALVTMGMDARWGVFGADEIGAPHSRRRLFVLGYDPDRHYAIRERAAKGSSVPIRSEHPEEGQDQHNWLGELGPECHISRSETYSDVVREIHGIPRGMDRLRAIGNGQVPHVVRLAWETLIQGGQNG